MKEARYIIVLAAITLCCATLLGAVYQVTAEPIAQAKMKAITEGIATVLPQGVKADVEKKIVVDENDPLSPVIYPAFKDGKLVAAAVKATDTNGYGGNVVVMVGLTGLSGKNLKVLTTSVLDISKETPGLGSKVTEPDFAGQFNGRGVTFPDLKVEKDGGEVKAVSGATITSRAFVGCVNTAIKAWQEKGSALLKGENNG